jgi:hypothetical protein
MVGVQLMCVCASQVNVIASCCDCRIEESLLKLEKEARAHHLLVFGQDSMSPPPEATEGR